MLFIFSNMQCCFASSLHGYPYLSHFEIWCSKPAEAMALLSLVLHADFNMVREHFYFCTSLSTCKSEFPTTVNYKNILLHRYIICVVNTYI